MILDTTHERAIDLMIGSGLTTLPVDNAKAVLLLRATNGDPIVFRMILAARAANRRWLTLTQRKWQAKPRTISEQDIERRCKLWDCNYGTAAGALIESVTTREHYVRCG